MSGSGNATQAINRTAVRRVFRLFGVKREFEPDKEFTDEEMRSLIREVVNDGEPSREALLVAVL
jgi:Mg2+/Co2+ transporter CorB